MAGDFSFVAKVVSPAKCNEKPWDLWVSEIGHSSPRRDDDGAAVFLAPAAADGKPVPRRDHPYKPGAPAGAAPRYRRAGLHRLRYDSMSLHGLFPQMDNLNAAICHMCGVVVKCSAAYRHLLESHTGSEPILPPPPPAPTVKLKSHSRSRHKKELPPPPPPIDIMPLPMDTSLYTSTPPLSRIVIPQPELQYLEEPGTSSAVNAEVQVCVETGELPVVSIQDTEDLPLGENITDDIVDIMNSEGIQSADDITNAADWKNIIRDIGKMQDLNFPQTNDMVQTQDLFSTVDTTLTAYTMTDPDLSSLQFAQNTSPMRASVLDTNVLNTQTLKPVTPSTPTSKTQRAKTKSKFNLREYDPNKHCGVVTVDNPKPCTRSLTCKAHALSLRRTVEGRAKPFDTLLAEHRAARDSGGPAAAAAAAAVAAAAAEAAAAAPAPAPLQVVPPTNTPLLPPLLDLSAFNGLTEEQQVNDIYESLVGLGDAHALPDTSSITSLLSPPLPLPTEAFLLPDDAEVPEAPAPAPAPAPGPARPERSDDCPPTLVPSDVCWYAACPRPLALCTFNASHAGGAITLGKKFATVRSNIKSSLSRSQCKTSATNNYYYNQNALSLSKTVHMNNASKTNKPEVRKLIVTCSAGGGAGARAAALGELFGVNGHAAHAPARRALKSKLPAGPFGLDPLLDEKC